MSQILLEKHDRVATITLNRPEKLNALNLNMLGELYRIIAEIEIDKDVQCVIVTGSGDRAFCVGADINDWADLDPMAMAQEWIRLGHRIYDRLAGLPQPSIVALNGFTFGGGLELALACDIRLSSIDAQFALPEVSIGTVPGWGGTKRLPKVIGEGRAKQMVFTGDRIGAEKAEAWGLVNSIHPSSELMAVTRALADRILANAPLAVQVAKETMSENGRTLEALAGAFTSTTNDLKEGVASFREKRKAEFKGE